MNKLKLSRKNIISLAVIILLLTGLLVFNFNIIYNRSWENITASCKTQVVQTAENIDSILRNSLDSVKIAAYEINIMQENNSGNDAILEYLEHHSVVYEKAVDSSYAGLYGVFDGVYLDGIGWEPEPDYVPEERPWYKEAVKADGHAVKVTPYLDSMTDTVRMSISCLLPDKKSVVALDISLEGIQGIVEECVSCNNWRYVMVLDDELKVAAHSDEDEIGKTYDSSSIGMGRDIAKGVSKKDVFEVNDEDGSYIAFAGQIEDDWIIVSMIEKGKLRGQLNMIIVMFILTLLLVFVAVIYVFIITKRRQLHGKALEHQIKAVSKVFASMYLINIINNTYSEVYNSNEDIRGMLEDSEGSAQYLIRKVMDAMTDERFKQGIYEFIEFSTLNDRLKGRKSISREFISYSNVRCIARFVPVEWNDEGRLETVMWMAEISDERNGTAV